MRMMRAQCTLLYHGACPVHIIIWVIFNHARPTYETIRNIKSNHALESSHGETARTG